MNKHPLWEHPLWEHPLWEHPLWGWVPSKLWPTATDLLCRWQWVGGRRFDAPFFDQTLQQCAHEAPNSAPYQTVTTLDGMVELTRTVPTVSPTAFIFHVSRCGSTLLSQLLALGEQRIVLSEVPLLDELLRLPERWPTVTPDRQEEYIRAALRLLGQQRTGREEQLFVKLDSWHVHYYDRLRQMFPTVPMVLLYRSPGPVMASHRKHRGMHAVPGLLPPRLFGMTAANLNRLDFDAYTSGVLSYYYAQFLHIAEADTRAILLAYQPDGFDLMTALVYGLGLDVSEPDWRAIRERSRYHAKRPEQVFGEENATGAGSTDDESAITWFERLENKRLTPTL